MRYLLLALTVLAGLDCGGSEPIQEAEFPICASVTALSACGGHASDGRLCATCVNTQDPVLGCHVFRDAAQGTGVTGPAVIADYECVASCDSCAN